jgi:molecular chaperone GrpE (heat shock protein)
VFAWLRRWFRRGAPPAPDAEDGALALHREARTLRLELEERDRVIAALKADLERLRRGEGERVTAAIRAERAPLLAEAAAPVAQLLTQAHLLEVEGKPVQARDVLAVARRLVRLLEDEGLAPEGRVGETVAFDPDRHEALGGGFAPRPGQPAVVRLVGISWQGRVLRKAGVGPAGE